MLHSNGSALTALRFVDMPTVNLPVWPTDADDCDECLRATCRWLDAYFVGSLPSTLPPLQPHGTPFQQAVWRELLTIPYGATATYGNIARRIGCRSAQAVGQAIGRNPIALLIPCHRVVSSKGTLTGYAYGIERKQWLLQLEKKSLPTFSI